MRGFRFYEEFSNKRKGVSAGQVVAVSTEHTRGVMLDAVASVFDRANSPVESTMVDRGWLRQKCKRVSEERARQVHPKLFSYLK